eukprot:XP_015572991.1 uncharacterized protein LOC8281219 [Ricinus communis]
MKRKKLLLNEKVEVRQFEEGLRGSWHPGVVVSVSKFCRSVEYDELLSETGNSKLIESITVTEAIEGIHCRRPAPSAYRGRIRPLPESSDTCEKLSFGVCVDALFEDAWWEGIVFDCHDDADERLVFFPDEGDEKKFSVSQLRITRDWDEFLGIWCDRGVWILVQLAMELEGEVSNYVKKFWLYLRFNDEFNKSISDWTCGVRNVWRKCFMNSANDTGAEFRRQVLGNQSLSNVIEKNGYKLKDTSHEMITSSSSLSSRKEKKNGPLTIDGSSQNIEEKDSPPQCSRRPLKVRYRSIKQILTNMTVSISSMPTHDKQSAKIKSVEDKATSEGDENGCFLGCSKQEKIDHIRGRRNLTKSRRMTRTLADRSQKVLRKSPLHDILPEQRKHSSTKIRVSKQFQQAGSEFKPRSKVKVEEVLDAIKATKNMLSQPGKRKRKRRNSSLSDTICSFCHYGGDLILCDKCPSTFHLGCLELKDVPLENWFCPSCCCELCGKGDSSTSTNACLQCARAYHVHCLTKDGCLLPTDYPSENFCSKSCYELCAQLHQLLGISNPTSVDGLTWTLTRSSKDVYNFPGMPRSSTHVKSFQILRVMHECFRSVKEPHTQKDMVTDLIYNSGSKFKRLNFHGFYAVVLNRGDQIVSVATLRIHGLKAAEMPLVATPFNFRRQGMCRLLMQEVLKLLNKFRVERLILPAIPQLRKMWEASFGFSEMPLSERQQLSGYSFVGFQGTMMLQNVLTSSRITLEINANSEGMSQDLEGNSSRIFLECNYVPNDESRFSGIVYEHKEKGKIIGKENNFNAAM